MVEPLVAPSTLHQEACCLKRADSPMSHSSVATWKTKGPLSLQSNSQTIRSSSPGFEQSTSPTARKRSKTMRGKPFRQRTLTTQPSVHLTTLSRVPRRTATLARRASTSAPLLCMAIFASSLIDDKFWSRRYRRTTLPRSGPTTSRTLPLTQPSLWECLTAPIST